VRVTEAIDPFRRLRAVPRTTKTEPSTVLVAHLAAAVRSSDDAIFSRGATFFFTLREGEQP